MNKLDKQYQALLQDILDNGVQKSDRTGTGTISVFGRQIRHKMSEGFPLLTTKKMYMKGIITELLWFLRGDTNIKYLIDNDCHIWNGDCYKNYLIKFEILMGHGFHGRLLSQEEFINKIKTDDEFAKTWGELGPIYGKQWRGWEDANHLNVEIDQIQNLINDIKRDPDSRRLMVTAWNPSDLQRQVLPPCHYGFQVYTRELSVKERMEIYFNQHPDWAMVGTHSFFDKHNIPTRAISLMWNQRSVDTFLGLPFNIASYGLLLEIIAKEVNMVPDELIGNLGDVHLYSNHIEQAKEQIGKKLSLDERIDIWFHSHKPNRDVVEYFDRLSYDRKKAFLDKGGVISESREPYPLPKLKFSWYIENWSTEEAKNARENTFDAYIRQMKSSDFIVENYQSHPTIKAPLSN